MQQIKILYSGRKDQLWLRIKTTNFSFFPSIFMLVRMWAMQSCSHEMAVVALAVFVVMVVALVVLVVMVVAVLLVVTVMTLVLTVLVVMLVLALWLAVMVVLGVLPVFLTFVS